MSIVNYGRRGVCGSRSNISRITSKALCDICRYCCVRAELAFIRSANDNDCLARMSFDRRKSTQITLSRNMTHSSQVWPSLSATCKRHASFPRAVNTVGTAPWNASPTFADANGLLRGKRRRRLRKSTRKPAQIAARACRSAARKVVAWRRPTRVYPQSAHSYLLNCADRELDAAVSQLDWRGEIGG